MEKPLKITLNVWRQKNAADAGRKACRRPRGPPRILADGSGVPSWAWVAVGAPGPEKVAKI